MHRFSRRALTNLAISATHASFVKHCGQHSCDLSRTLNSDALGTILCLLCVHLARVVRKYSGHEKYYLINSKKKSNR